MNRRIVFGRAILPSHRFTLSPSPLLEEKGPGDEEDCAWHRYASLHLTFPSTDRQPNWSIRQPSAYRSSTKQWLLNIAGWHGRYRLLQSNLWPTTTDNSVVTQMASSIQLNRSNLYQIVRGYGLMPFEPKLPTRWHAIGALYFNDARSLPMSTPPCRRMQTPQGRFVRPPGLHMVGR